jgi:nucleoside-diphosphate-sugar epimerase
MRAVIIGCGYVGRVLGTLLCAGGHEVIGVARSASSLASIERRGITPQEADITQPATIDALPDAAWVIVSVSSGGGDAAAARAVFEVGLTSVIESYAQRERPPDRLVFTSSSSVYGDRDGAWVDEETAPDPQTDKTAVLATAEELAIEHSASLGIDGTVCRFAGLYGPGRYRLQRYLGETVTTGYLNMVHRVDAAGAIAHLLGTNRGRGQVVNVVDDRPIDRHAFATALAQLAGTTPPDRRPLADRLRDTSLSDDARRRLAAQKRVSNDRLRTLGYRLRHPTFRSGYATPIAQRHRG